MEITGVKEKENKKSSTQDEQKRKKSTEDLSLKNELERDIVFECLCV